MPALKRSGSSFAERNDVKPTDLGWAEPAAASSSSKLGVDAPPAAGVKSESDNADSASEVRLNRQVVAWRHCTRLTRCCTGLEGQGEGRLGGGAGQGRGATLREARPGGGNLACDPHSQHRRLHLVHWREEACVFSRAFPAVTETRADRSPSPTVKNGSEIELRRVSCSPGSFDSLVAELTRFSLHFARITSMSGTPTPSWLVYLEVSRLAW